MRDRRPAGRLVTSMLFVVVVAAAGIALPAEAAIARDASSVTAADGRARTVRRLMPVRHRRATHTHHRRRHVVRHHRRVRRRVVRHRVRTTSAKARVIAPKRRPAKRSVVHRGAVRPGTGRLARPGVHRGRPPLRRGRLIAQRAHHGKKKRSSTGISHKRAALVVGLLVLGAIALYVMGNPLRAGPRPRKRRRTRVQPSTSGP